MRSRSLTIATIRQPAFLYDADGTIAEANEPAEALAGRPLEGRSAVDVIDIFDIRSSDGMPLMASDLPAVRVLAGEEAVDVPLTVTASDGRTMHVLATASPLREEDRIVGAFSIWQDISALEAARAGAETSALELAVQQEELRQAATALAGERVELDRQRRLLDAILGTLPHRISLWDRDQRLVWANERVTAERGWPREALVGRSWRELGVDMAVAGHLSGDALQSIAAGRPFSSEFEVAGPGGPTRQAITVLPVFGDSILVMTEDVTERHRAEDALRESEERLRLAKTCARIGIWEWHLPAAGAAGSREYVRLYETAPDALQFDDWQRTVHPDDLERVVAARDAALARREPFELEFRYNPGEGTFRWMRILGGGVFDEEGRLLRVLGVNMDITDQKEAEAALRESERRHAFLLTLGDCLRDLPDVSEIAAAASEMLGRHLGANGAVYCEVDEAGECATVRADWTDGTLPGAAGRFRMDDFGIGDLYCRGLIRWTDDVTTECGEDEATVHRAFRIRASLGVPICRGDRLAAVLTVHSVRPRAWTDAEVELVRQVGDRVWASVERARAEEAVRERERTLQGIFRAAPVGIGMVSDRRITQANDQLCRMTGYTSDELIGQDARLFYPSDEAYEFVGREKYAQIMADGIGAVETQWRTKDGTVLDILLSSSPLDLSRPHENVVFNALNITRLRESERALESYMDGLQRSNEELQRFAYVASHDLQEPLRSIISFSQLLERRYRGRLDQDADEYIQFIVEGGNRMQRLIMDLLQLSRVETKAKPLVPTDAGEVVADALRLLETPIREAGATVTVEELPTVIADAAQLAQVFTNLVGNALKYRRPDVPPTIRISAEREGHFWRFAVADNGIGIEAEYFDRIFVIFQRLHTRDEYEGTGIGLAVVRKIVERHGGRIGVESVPGEGSTFFFTLPAA